MNNHLSPDDLIALRTKLEQRLTDLHGQIRALKAAQAVDQIDANEPRDLEEVSALVTEWDRDNILELEARNHVAEVEHALSKIAIGTYGLCEQCGRPIPVARLRIVPETRYDVEHQSAREIAMSGRGGATPRARDR
jgi:RNA polymerase-binding transcription factor DksA